MPMKLYLEKEQAQIKRNLHPCPGKQTAAKAMHEDIRNFFTTMLHAEKLEERSEDPRIAFQTRENTLQIVLANKAIHLTAFCCSRGAPRSLGKHSKACWITLQTPLSYLRAIKIEFNLNTHPLKVTAILLKVKILLNFSKKFS